MLNSRYSQTRNPYNGNESRAGDQSDKQSKKIVGSASQKNGGGSYSKLGIQVHHSHDGEVVKLRMQNIEKKIQKANEKREGYINTTLEKQMNYQQQFERALHVKGEIAEKQHYDTMNKVVLKHHNKDKQLRLLNRQIKEESAMKNEKKLQSMMHVKQNLKHIEEQRKEKMSRLQEKFNKLEMSKRGLDSSMVDYVSAKKESNMYKMMEHEDNLKQVKRGQSAYKRDLI
mmetsp:Transcript_4715/g.8052  ORF Transcript_4715/g.8052 Transcript_4715/m.8052 type:complete len:228 (-) Transcript_4715:321-1004(-)